MLFKFQQIGAVGWSQGRVPWQRVVLVGRGWGTQSSKEGLEPGILWTYCQARDARSSLGAQRKERLWSRSRCRFRPIQSLSLFCCAKCQPWDGVKLLQEVFWLFFLFILVHVGTLILSTMFANMSWNFKILLLKCLISTEQYSSSKTHDLSVFCEMCHVEIVFSVLNIKLHHPI